MLADAGYVDDARLARRRALVLAERGWGDEAILERLAGEGLSGSEAEAAVAALEPEVERAEVLANRQDPRRAWQFLRRRGFDPETIESVCGALDETTADGLG